MSIFKACVSGRSKKATFMYSMKDSMVKTDHKSKDDPNMTEWSSKTVKTHDPSENGEEERVAFWNSGLSVCIKCGQRNLESQEIRAGVRANGEAHGTDVFTCRTEHCGWSVSYLFDDAYEDCWHYEAMGWSRGIQGYPVCYMLLWAEKHKLPKSIMDKIRGDQVTGNTMLDMAQNNGEKGLEDTLGISKKVAEKIRKALMDKRGPILKG